MNMELEVYETINSDGIAANNECCSCLTEVIVECSENKYKKIPVGLRGQEKIKEIIICVICRESSFLAPKEQLFDQKEIPQNQFHDYCRW